MISILRSNLVRSSALIAASAFFVACGGSTEPKVPPRDNVPATITSTTTGTLTGQAGSTLNTLLSVVVKNKAGQGADSALVTFTVTSGGGSVSNTTVRTDTTGVASTTWTLGGTAGTQTVTATVGTLAPVTFTATASATAATNLAKVAGDNQTATVSTNVAVAPSVKVTDKFGNPVANVLVNFSANNGGSVTGASVSTDANGVAAVSSWKLGPTVGTNTLTATVTGISAPVTFTATGTIGAIARVTITSAAIPTLNIGQTATVTAQAFDANNNLVSNPGIVFSSSNTAVATVNATSGLVTAVGAGTASIIATANGQTSSTPVTVIGKAGITLDTAIAMGSRVRNIVTAGSIAYAALSTSQNVATVNPATRGIATTGPSLGSTVVDVAVNANGTVVIAATSSPNARVYILNSSLTPVDSIDLPAAPVKIAMTSDGQRLLVDMANFNLAVIDVPGRNIISTPVFAGTVNTMKVAPGDSLAYVGVALGVVYELNTQTGAIRRQFQLSSNQILDLAVSRDAKTLYVVDGSTVVTYRALTTGGRTGTADFGNSIALSSVAISPDNTALYVTQLNTLVTAPFEDGEFFTGSTGNRTVVSGSTLLHLALTATGSQIFAIDDAGNRVVIFK